MIAVVQETKEEKVFLVEEWIHTDEGNHQFVKYINNHLPMSCLPIMPPLVTIGTNFHFPPSYGLPGIPEIPKNPKDYEQ